MDLKRHVFLLQPIVVLAMAAGASATAFDGSRGDMRPPLPTRWVSPDGTPRPTHPAPAERGPLVVVPAAPETRERTTGPLPPAPRGRLCLVVADTVYDAIDAGLSTYQQDLEDQGYEVTTYRLLSGTAEELRGFLHGLYAETASLVGAVLIGDIPCVIYEMMQDFDPYDAEPPEYEDFPCDIFYMDLDGTWGDELTDADVQPGNGKYDTRSGDTDLEIWVCRLKTSDLMIGTETDLLTNYFGKNHAYRSAQFRPACRALVYPDDDWNYMASEDTAAVQTWYASSALDVVADPNETTAADYMSRLTADYELIHTRSHGYPGGHMYYRNDGSASDWVFVSDYSALQPTALFYSLFVCSGADYTASNYLAGVAAFNIDSGLFVWGSTKTGGMWLDSPFYASLDAGNSFGRAFLDWYNYVAPQHPEYAPHWWYGMVLLGDATLPARSFSDVGRDHWAFREIEACAAAGIVGGYEDGSYQPGWAVTRDQMAVYIARAIAGGDMSVPAAAGDPTFPDVLATHWAYDYVEYAVGQSVVAGYEDGAYHPEYQVTRDQMAVYVARALVAPTGEAALADYVPADPRNFPDVPDTHWAWKNIEYCVENGVVQGYEDGCYHAEYVVTRDQMAVYVARAFELGS